MKRRPIMFGKLKISKRVLTAALALSLILTASAAGLCTAAAEDETATPIYPVRERNCVYSGRRGRRGRLIAE
ncbi:MAG: hypothetical protein ACLR56_14960 [Oscillospiraceae bacterium]